MKVLVHDGFGLWLCARRLQQGQFVRPDTHLGSSFELTTEQLRALVVGLPWQRLSEYARISVHDDLDAFMKTVAPRRVFAVSTRGRARYDRVEYAEDDALLFGPETRGLPQSILDALPPEQCLRLPMVPGNRSLNLSNAVAVIVFEAWRQMGFVGGDA